MRAALICLLLLPFTVQAQDAERFQRTLNARSEHALDRWIAREIHRRRKGHLVTTPSASYIVHDPTHDSLVTFLRRQPGVEDAAWDRCMKKAAIWPGHSTIGMRWHARGQVFERCWSVQEGIPGTINFFGFRPRVRKTREHMRYLRATACPGFVVQQRRYCEELKR